jgi:hypothetical protein
LHSCFRRYSALVVEAYSILPWGEGDETNINTGGIASINGSNGDPELLPLRGIVRMALNPREEGDETNSSASGELLGEDEVSSATLLSFLSAQQARRKAHGRT